MDCFIKFHFKFVLSLIYRFHKKYVCSQKCMWVPFLKFDLAKFGLAKAKKPILRGLMFSEKFSKLDL